MEFDRSAPGRGVEAKCRLENGKAFLEWRFYLTDESSQVQARQTQAPETQVRQMQVSQTQIQQTKAQGCETYAGRNEPAWSQPVISISLMAGEGNVAAKGMQAIEEEEPLETVLVQPRLWQGMKDPFLYEAEAALIWQGVCLDKVRTQFCLRRLETGGEDEVLLNGQPLEVRAVAYSLPDAGSEAERQSQVISDFRQLAQLGANSICIDRKDPSSFLLGICDRFGFLALERSAGKETDPFVCTWNRAVKVHWKGEDGGEKVPAYRGGPEAFFLPHRKCPTSIYYKYKSKWSKDPFVYLVPESVRRLKSGNYTVTCYSSCGRVALYTDGELFEFRKGDVEFVFQEIPARTPCIMLSAEGDGCSVALSVHKSFVKAQEEKSQNC